MSIDVRLDDLRSALEEFASGYLLTSREGRIKVVTVDPTCAEDGLHIEGPGRGTLANLSANPFVTLTFPPREARGYTLIVDGEARGEGDDVTVTPTHAVLHRPARHSDGPPPPDGCGHDCTPVT